MAVKDYMLFPIYRDSVLQFAVARVRLEDENRCFMYLVTPARHGGRGSVPFGLHYPKQQLPCGVVAIRHMPGRQSCHPTRRG